MKARIKTNGKIVEVISRFMPRKRNTASRDWVCNLSDGTCVDESQIEYIEEHVEGLEEAARAFEKNNPTKAYWFEGEFVTESTPLSVAFKAGAEWMKAKIGKQAREQLAKDEITLADLVAFDEGCSLGRRLERQNMMKDAVEGVVCYGSKGAYIETDFLGEYDTNVYGNSGDKVRVIVIKEDEL